ncbi:omega-conotoxin-like protein 1 [Belonocnema kinseyi]|uniref:omega-conotoxin-like protein 1 n=1 Tax=Belonocnema kinseyi TaxID=2817044 RepID=UPI00143DBA14|nr:omega-conotoxin-like protein 1 [Belonocnema kinseyi]
MSKFVLFCIVACLAVTVISGRSTNSRDDRIQKFGCSQHGDPCSSDSQCCNAVKMTCHRYAGRCQVVITAEDLQEQKTKLKPTGHKLW